MPIVLPAPVPVVRPTTVNLRPNDVQFVNAVARYYVTPSWSEQELISVMNDIMRLIYKLASQYTDPTCFELCQDELEAAGREKLVARLQKGVLIKFTKRPDLFKHSKACLNNHLKGFVHRNRYTVKRTGRKVPPKRAFLRNNAENRENIAILTKLAGADYKEKIRHKISVVHKGKTYYCDLDTRGAISDAERKYGSWYYLAEAQYDRSFKPEVSLSDPDASAAVGRAASNVDDNSIREFTEDLRGLLTPMEFLVYCQLVQPNDISLVHATLDMWRGPGKLKDKCAQLLIREEHLADGLGLDLETFRTISEKLKPKITHYMSDKGAELEGGYHVAVTALEKVFGLQIHRSIDPLVLKRLLTVAARINYEKVDENVANLLRAVGAQVPAVGGNGNLICYGALHQKNNRTCLQCGVRAACAVETANYGLDDIVLSPKLLSVRGLTRTPSVTNEMPSGDMTAVTMTTSPVAVAVATATVADDTLVETTLDLGSDEVQAYLNEHFIPARFKDKIYFRHKDRRKDDVKYIFRLDRRNDKLCVRLCKPSPKLAACLEKEGAGHYPPSGASMGQIVELISQHALETF